MSYSSSPLHSAPLEPLAPRDASSPVPPAVPSGVSALGSESEPVNSGYAASAASSSFAAAFSLAPFQSIPVCSHHLLGTRSPGRLTNPSHRPRISHVAINCAIVFYLRRIDVQIRTIPASFIAPTRDR